MPTQAVQHIRRMRGGAQSHLMRCADNNYYGGLEGSRRAQIHR